MVEKLSPVLLSNKLPHFSAQNIDAIIQISKPEYLAVIRNIDNNSVYTNARTHLMKRTHI